jgi:tRNA A-37 threonylcarbamoyl transferase component Bud32/tetratricopeptide (TPR) repeat protein
MSDQPDNKPVVKDLSGKIGKYEIVRPLGKGAMGQVYVAHDTILDRDVALKVMVANIADDPELKQRFAREARAVAKMTHPNVVMVFDLFDHTDGSPVIAMELLKGLDLQKAIRSPPPMPVDRKVAIIVQVLAGLAHAHQAGIVHRDIKPANIFIQHDGSVKIMDFGVARLTTASMTGTGNIVGTADYMSPEQVKGSKVDGRSDVFSVGCMLYEMMAGRRPFHSDNLMAIFYKITHEEPNFDLIPVGPEYDALLPILRKSLAKELADRFQTAYDFAIALREWLKVHATGAHGKVLEQLGDMEAPTSPPQPLTEAPGATVVPVQPGEVTDVGTGRRPMSAPGARPGARPNAAATQGGAAAVPTVVGSAPGQTFRPGTTRLGGAAAPTVIRPTRPERAPSGGGNPGLYVVLGGMLVALVGTGGYILWTKMNPPPPPTTLASAPPTTALAPPTLATPTPPPPSAAPPPTFAEAKGRGAPAMKTAQTAFNAGNYDRALSAAQEVLREDPGNADAKRMAENALNGQKAAARLRAADAALRQGDMATATTEAEAARTFASWDTRATDMIVRIRDAQAQAEREKQAKAQSEQAQKQQLLTAQVNKYVNDASTALGNKQYDAAIKLYDEALKLDGSNVAAIQGRTGAITARALSETPGPRDPGRSSGHTFVAGKTQASSGEAKTTGGPVDFEESAGVTVKPASQAAALPGKILFEVSPDGVRAGDRYVVNIQLANEGDAPIQIRAMQLTTTVNGRKSQGPVPTLVKDVAPKQKALLYKLEGEIWKEDTSAWSMEAIVTTIRGETYRNNVSWK